VGNSSYTLTNTIVSHRLRFRAQHETFPNEHADDYENRQLKGFWHPSAVGELGRTPS